MSQPGSQSSDHVEERVKRVLAERIPLSVRVEDLKDDTPLIGGGLGLDSVALLQLVVGLEEEFGIQVDEAEVNVDLFADVSSVAAYVRRKLGE